MPTCLLHIPQYFLHLASTIAARSFNAGRYLPCASRLPASQQDVKEDFEGRKVVSLLMYPGQLCNSASGGGRFSRHLLAAALDYSCLSIAKSHRIVRNLQLALQPSNKSRDRRYCALDREGVFKRPSGPSETS